jgi:putative two-component system response regulator
MTNHRASPALKVLIVDDDITFSHSMRRILTGAGYDCRAVASGAAARQELNDGDIAAVLCDVTMPGESGLDLLATLAADFPEVAVVMTTGADDPATAAQAYDIGAYGYLIKPFTVNEIRITLESALRRSELDAARRDHLRGLERTVAQLRRVHGVVADIETGAIGSSSDSDKSATERLSRALSVDHDEPRLHIERMSRISAVLAEAVGFADCSTDEFRRAATLHDVGMVMVPEAILLKPGSLTVEEDRALQRHARVGYQLLAGSTSPLMRVAASIALCHHEWWDGSGYPRGLRGKDIPLEARIVAVADVFDALTSDRVNRPGLPIDAAFDTLTELRGRQFEPHLLDVFGGLLAETEAIMAVYPDQADQPRIRLLVVDDDEVFVHGLRALLGTEPSIAIAGTAATAAEAEQVAKACGPDVVLIDFDLLEGEGTRLTEAIRALVPEAHVLVLTDQPPPVGAVGGGAGFVAKNATLDILLEAIHYVHEGEVPSSVLSRPRLAFQPRPDSSGLGSDLSPRELEVLRMMAAGASNKVLAAELYLSLNTIRNHVQSILYKLDVHSKLEAVATAVRAGLIELDDQVGPSR